MLILDGNYTTGFRIGPPRFSNPFAGLRIDLGAVDQDIILDEDHIQFEVNYQSNVPPRPGLGSEHPDYPGYYLVADGLDPKKEIGGNIRQWTRRWSRIPESRVDYESFPWTIPGLSGAIDGQPQIRVRTSSYDPDTGTLSIETFTPHGLTAADKFRMFFSNPTSALKPVGFYVGDVGTIDGPNTFTSEFLNPGVAIITCFAIQKTTATSVVVNGQTYHIVFRAPKTVPIPSEIHYDYFLAGVSPGIGSPADIPIFPSFNNQIYNGAEEATQILDFNTTPTINDYLTLVTAQTMIVAADSTTKIFQGPIIERITRRVRAQ